MSYDTAPTNQAALRHGAGQPPARVAQPGELLFEFLRGHDRMRCELRDHGPVYGVEAQFLRNEEFEYSRRWPTRALAVAWAEAERKAIERGD